MSNKLVRGSRGARGSDGDPGSSPWAGSLRHVDENKMRRKKPKESGNLGINHLTLSCL